MPRKNHTPRHHPFAPNHNCQQKRQFFSEEEAQHAAEYQMLIKPALILHVYLCPQCQQWHLTRLPHSGQQKPA